MIYGYGEPCGPNCMMDNGCHGFRECEGCGHRFCIHDLDEHRLCPRCAEKAEEYMDEDDEECEDCEEGAVVA